MEKENVVRMMDVLREPVQTEDDMRFIRNNLEGFQKLLLDMTTHELIKDGVEPEKVDTLLQPLVEISKMLGASSFADFQTVAGLLGDDNG